MTVSPNSTAGYAIAKPGLLDESTYQGLLHLNFLTIALSCFGVVGNGFNIAVFLKQGFKESINISLFTLALSDCNILLWVSMAAFCVLPGAEDFDLPIPAVDVWTIVAWQATSMVYGNCWLAAFISLERCLSIAKPLHVKSIITHKVTIVSVVIITFVCMFYLSPLYTTMSLELQFDVKQNRSLLHLVFNSERTTGQFVAYVLHIFMQVGSFVTLVTATGVLVISLRRKTKWRASISASRLYERQMDKQTSGQSEKIMSSKDKRVSTMVILISSVILICVVPGLALSAVALVEPEFEVKLRYERAHIVCWSCAHLLHAFNSSINVFIYFNMSSRYRETFKTQVISSGYK